MNAKNGVITEERFQKMTPAQWLFHYKEIVRQNKLDIEEKKAEIIMQNKMFDILVQTIESVGILANPDVGMKILNDRKNKENLDKIAKGEDELLNYLQENEDLIPKTIIVKNAEQNKTKFFLKKYKRGIVPEKK